MEKTTCPTCSLKPALSVCSLGKGDVKNAWLYCKCGTIFQTGIQNKSIFNDDYRKKFEDGQDSRKRHNYIVRQYVPLIEELTYGRKFLGVGHTLNYVTEDMSRRGWLTSKIDLIDNYSITGDFETYEFETKFNFIHLAHVVECFQDWKGALLKAANLLSSNGVLLITSINPKMVHIYGVSDFGVFENAECLQYVPAEQIIKFLEYHGMKLVLNKENENKRFVIWGDNHLIFQREL